VFLFYFNKIALGKLKEEIGKLLYDTFCDFFIYYFYTISLYLGKRIRYRVFAMNTLKPLTSSLGPRYAVL
jgi:hypothetical protein